MIEFTQPTTIKLDQPVNKQPTTIKLDQPVNKQPTTIDLLIDNLSKLELFKSWKNLHPFLFKTDLIIFYIGSLIKEKDKNDIIGILLKDLSFLDEIIEGPFDQNIKHMLNNLKEVNNFDKLLNSMEKYIDISSISYVKINLKLYLNNLQIDIENTNFEKGNSDRYK